MQSETILVIDDSADDVFLFERTLKKVAPETVLQVASDGMAAINCLNEYIASKSELPLLALVDLNMPRFNGFELLAEIRTFPELSKLFVVVLSASDIISDVKLAYELGARSYLVKPAKGNDLLVLLEAAREFKKVDSWQPQQSLPGLPRPPS